MNAFGLQGVTMGNVPELDSVGDEFMKAVFTTEAGKHAVAANQPGRVIYVVRPTKFDPSIEELRARFKQPTSRFMAGFLGNNSDDILRQFYESIDERAGFVSFIEEEPAE